MIFKSISIMIAIILISFTVIAVQEPIIEGIPDIAINKDSGSLDKFLDLRDYASDDQESADDLFYVLKSQTNVHLIDCFIEQDHFVSCKDPAFSAIGMNTITIEVIDGGGLSDVDSFNLNVIQSSAVESIFFSADRDDIVMEPEDSMNVRLTIENTLTKRTCFDLTAFLDNDERDEIRATPGVEGFCLNSGERTSVSLTITSFDDARADFYDIEVNLTYPTGERTLFIDVEVVDQEDPIDIVRLSEYNVCKEPYTQEIEVRLENNSGRTQTIELNAEHELLLPVFEFPVTILSANDSDIMVRRIHTNETTALNEYTIPVFARSERYFVQRDITFRLIDCGTDEFDLDVTPNERRIDKGETERFTVVLTSNSDDDLDIRISSDSELPNQLETYRVTLSANSTTRIDLDVSARESDGDGTYKVIVTAWSSNETEEETVKVKVRAEHNIEMLISNNNFEARECSATAGQVYEVTLINKGDFDETIELDLKNVDDSIQAVLSQDEIDLDAGEEKTIYVFVNPSFGTPLGDYTITLTARTDDDELRETLRFRVVESDVIVQENVIELVSYPREVTIAPGEEKELLFTIRNPLPGPMENVSIRFFGTGDTAIFPLSLRTLEGKETITVKRTLSANEGIDDKIFNVTIEVRADGFVTIKPMKITVSNTPQTTTEESEENTILTGFVGLAGNNFLLGGLVILILLGLIVIVLSLLHSNKSDDIYYNSNNGAE